MKRHLAVSSAYSKTFRAMNLDLKETSAERKHIWEDSKTASGKKFSEYNKEILDVSWEWSEVCLTDWSSKPTHHWNIYNKTLGSIDTS